MANIHTLQRRLAALENFSAQKDLCHVAYETPEGLVPARPGATLARAIVIMPPPKTFEEWTAAVERGDYKTKGDL